MVADKRDTNREEVSEMPAGDGTGPLGMGPMTGRAAGYCTGYDAPGWSAPGPGPGFGLGWGGAWGRGRRNRYWARATGAPRWARGQSVSPWGTPPAWAFGPYGPAPSREQETESLRQRAEWLRRQLDEIGRRIEEPEGEE